MGGRSCEDTKLRTDDGRPTTELVPRSEGYLTGMKGKPFTEASESKCQPEGEQVGECAQRLPILSSESTLN